METRTISVRTIEAQTVQKLKNSEARPKYTGSSKTTCILIHADTLKRDLCQAGGDSNTDMTGMLVEIFKNNPSKLPMWMWHRHSLTPKSYQRNAKK